MRLQRDFVLINWFVLGFCNPIVNLRFFDFWNDNVVVKVVP